MSEPLDGFTVERHFSVLFRSFDAMEVSTKHASSSDISPTDEVHNLSDRKQTESEKEGETSKIRKPSGESSTTEFSSIATSTPSSSPLVSAATSLSSTQAACDDKADSPQNSEDCDLSSSDSSGTKTSPE